jgi:apolipoprotein N-acyltransferase
MSHPFNWNLFLFAMLGMLIAFIIDAVRSGGLKKMKKQTALLRYGALFLFALALVYWIHSEIVQTILVTLAIVGAAFVARNNLK